MEAAFSIYDMSLFLMPYMKPSFNYSLTTNIYTMF